MARTTAPNKPLHTLWDGPLKASVWPNESDKGPYYTVTLAKLYSDKDGQTKETQSFSASELLRVAELAREAHGVIRDLKRQRSQERKTEQVGEEREQPSRTNRPARFR